MNHSTPQEFHYHLNWRTRSIQAGARLTRTAGGHTDFQCFVPFMENPNPRRIDSRASLRSIPRQLMVRSYHERASIAVYVILDLSASMRFSGNSNKLSLVAEIVASAAWSAIRSGDLFGLVACDNTIRTDLFEPPTHRLSLVEEIRTKLMTTFRTDQTTHATAQIATASALPFAAEHIRQKRSLTFLISDFHLPDVLINRTMTSLSAHDVVPLVIWDSAEYSNMPNWGWARMKDMEGGEDRALFLRKRLLEKINDGYIKRRKDLTSQCLKAGIRTPFFIEDTFKAEQLTHHLLESN